MYLFLLLFCFISTRAYQKHLAPNQWHSIRSLLQNKETPPQIKEKINHILYIKYENLAERMAYKFKKLHSYKCSYIMLPDLYLSAKIGLYKAIKNYNQTYSFHPYVNIYIQGELYKCLTDYLPIQFHKTQQKKETIYKIPKITNKNDKYIDYDTLYSSPHPQIEYYCYLPEVSLTPFQKRILYIKYQYFLCDIKITNKKLAQYMGCSEEKVRYNIKEMIDQIRQK